MMRYAGILTGLLMVLNMVRADDPAPIVNQEPVAVYPTGAGYHCAPRCEQGRDKCWNFRQIFAWATYRPLPVPRDCRGFRPYIPEPVPPLYTFILQSNRYWEEPYYTHPCQTQPGCGKR